MCETEYFLSHVPHLFVWVVGKMEHVCVNTLYQRVYVHG